MVEPNPDVDAYVEQAPENRREGLRLLRDLCRRTDQIDVTVVRSILRMSVAGRGPSCWTDRRDDRDREWAD